jgi:hypothetical protein
MNEGYFLGEIIDVGKFKFIYGGDLIHKSVICLKMKLIDGQIVNLRGYDEVADLILRNEFKFVYISGKLKTEGYIQIKEIEKI